MQQYFEGRELSKSDIIEPQIEVESKIFANERKDSKWATNHTIIHYSTFAKMGFLKSSFKNDDLRFNVFIDCYFKRALFEDVNFTGSIFINCNFDEATIVNCIFEYCKFEGCIIEYKYLKESLSNRANLRWEICKNMSLECLKLGNEIDYRKYFFEEKKASEEYYFKKFWHKGKEQYYFKYNWVDQITGLGNFLLSKINKLLWGYGEKLSVLIFNMVLVIVIFTIVYYTKVTVIEDGSTMTVPFALYMSLCNFFTVTCDYTSVELNYKMYSVIEGGIGITLMGFFVAALFRYINKRG